MLLYLFCFAAGCIFGTGIMGILSAKSYQRGYSDALKKGEMFEY